MKLITVHNSDGDSGAIRGDMEVGEATGFDKVLVFFNQSGGITVEVRFVDFQGMEVCKMLMINNGVLYAPS